MRMGIDHSDDGLVGNFTKPLEESLGEAASVKTIWKPSLSTTVEEDQARTIMKLVAMLEDDDDVQNVFANFEVSDDVLSRLTAA